MLSIHQSLSGIPNRLVRILPNDIAGQLSKKADTTTPELAWSIFALAKRTEGLGSGLGEASFLSQVKKLYRQW